MSTIRPSLLFLVLTRQCIHRCDHCHSFASPMNRSAFSLRRLAKVIHQISRVNSLKTLVFTGGEPFLHYPLLRAGVFEASTVGLDPWAWTSGYFLHTVKDLRLALKGLKEVGLKGLLLSLDRLHKNEHLLGFSDLLQTLAQELGVELVTSSLEEKPGRSPPRFARKGDLPTQGPYAYRGRAADTIPAGTTLWSPDQLDTCPHRNLLSLDYLWLDPSELLHACPGIPIHSLQRGHIRRFLKGFDPTTHPVLGPLIEGGPYALAQHLGLHHIVTERGYADHCHLCFQIRRAALTTPYAPLVPPTWHYEPEDPLLLSFQREKPTGTPPKEPVPGTH